MKRVRDRRMDACLLAAFPPVEGQPEPAPSRNVKEALSRLDNEAQLLLEEIACELPFHGTLKQIVEHM